MCSNTCLVSEFYPPSIPTVILYSEEVIFTFVSGFFEQMALSRDEDEAHRDWMLGTPPLVAWHHVLMIVFSDAARHTLGRLRFRHISRLSGWDGYATLVVEIL